MIERLTLTQVAHVEDSSGARFPLGVGAVLVDASDHDDAMAEEARIKMNGFNHWQKRAEKAEAENAHLRAQLARGEVEMADVIAAALKNLRAELAEAKVERLKQDVDRLRSRLDYTARDNRIIDIVTAPTEADLEALTTVLCEIVGWFGDDMRFDKGEVTQFLAAIARRATEAT